MDGTCSVILAAGEGKRMKSDKPKVMSEVLFKPMIKWVVDSLNGANITDICAVCGYQHEKLEQYIKDQGLSVQTVIQHERKGSAHAVITADRFLKKNIGKDVLIVCGDSPLIDSQTILESLKLHKEGGNVATIISAKVSNPFGYGRIVRFDGTNKIVAIVEQKDADEVTRLITEVNSGAYWFNIEALLSVIYDISDNNAQGEFYLPDAIRFLINKNLPVDAYVVTDENIILGANDRFQLNSLNNTARTKILNSLMANGVDVPLSDGIIVGDNVQVGTDTRILPGSIIKGNTIIGKGCSIGPNCFIEDCIIEDNVDLKYVCCSNKNIKCNDTVNPFSVL